MTERLSKLVRFVSELHGENRQFKHWERASEFQNSCRKHEDFHLWVNLSSFTQKHDFKCARWFTHIWYNKVLERRLHTVMKAEWVPENEEWMLEMPKWKLPKERNQQTMLFIRLSVKYTLYNCITSDTKSNNDLWIKHRFKQNPRSVYRVYRTRLYVLNADRHYIYPNSYVYNFIPWNLNFLPFCIQKSSKLPSVNQSTFHFSTTPHS